MARLWSCGLELSSTGTDVEFTSGVAGGLTTIDSSVVRSGNYSMKIVNAPEVRGGFSNTFLASVSAGIWYARGYFNIGSLPSLGPCEIITYYNTGVGGKIGVRVTTGGLLQLWNVEDSLQIGSSSSALSTGTWYLIELNIDCTTIASTTANARLNGSSFASGSANLASGVNQLRVWESNTAGSNHNATVYWDDVAINDSIGSFQNSYPGEGKIIHLKPNAAGDNSAWTNDYLSVDEVTPDNATTLVSSNTLDQIDDHNIEAPASLGTSDTINVVQVGARFNGVGASANASFVLRIKAAASGTVEESSAITPASATWVTNAAAALRNYSLTLYDLPGESTTVWTKADLEAAQIGYRLSATSTNAAQVSTVWLLVDYTPVYGTLKAKPRRPVINWKI